MHYKYDVLCRSNSGCTINMMYVLCRSNSGCTINMMYYVGVIVGAL